MHHKAIVIDIGCWHKNRHVDQWSRVQSPEPIHECSIDFQHKCERVKNDPSGVSGTTGCRKMESDPYLTLYEKLPQDG